jgi:biopolymer transport protein ExbB/TolQ
VKSVHPVIAATLAHSIERSIYDVSRVLLYPVLVAALFCLGWAIVEVGWFLYELYLRVRYRDLEALEIRTLKARDAFAKGQPRRAYKYLQESNYSTVVARFLFDLIRNYQTERIAEKPLKLLQEYEFYTVKRLEKTRILVRIGPMLGLMGTLIPLAPALAGLASGNTAVLAANLEIAFSVTVIGLLIGGLGFIVSIVRDRFYQQDISDLEYMLELLEGGGGRLRLGPPPCRLRHRRRRSARPDDHAPGRRRTDAERRRRAGGGARRGAAPRSKRLARRRRRTARGRRAD